MGAKAIQLQPQTKVVGTSKLDNVSTHSLQSMLENRAFYQLKGKNHLIINTVSGGGELAIPSPPASVDV